MLEIRSRSVDLERIVQGHVPSLPLGEWLRHLFHGGAEPSGLALHLRSTPAPSALGHC